MNNIVKKVLLGELCAIGGSVVLTAFIVFVYGAFAQEKKVFIVVTALTQLQVVITFIELWIRARRARKYS